MHYVLCELHCQYELNKKALLFLIIRVMPALNVAFKCHVSSVVDISRYCNRT